MKIQIWFSLILALLLVTIPVLGDGLTTISGIIPKDGINKVTLDNSQNDKAAVVVFSDLNWPVPFAVYVSSKQSGVLYLPSSSYQIYYTNGQGWDNSEKKFMSQSGYYMLADVLNTGADGIVHDDERPWAENIISLSPDSYDTAISITAEEFPVF